MLDNGPHAIMVLRMLCKYPLDTDVRDKKTTKTVLELCNTKGRKRLMPLLVEAIQTWNNFKEAVMLGLDKPEVRRSMHILGLTLQYYFSTMTLFVIVLNSQVIHSTMKKLFMLFDVCYLRYRSNATSHTRE